MDYIARITELENQLSSARSTISELKAELKNAQARADSMSRRLNEDASEIERHLERFAEIKAIIDPWLQSYGKCT